MTRLLRRMFSAEALGLILILVTLQAFVYGIGSSLRNTDTSSFFWVCLLAALIAFGLSKRKSNGIHSAIGMIALGFIGVWILGARLAAPLVDLGEAILAVIPQILPAIREHLPIDTTVIGDRWLVVLESSNALSLRVQAWVLSLNRNVPVNDVLLRNLAWVLIIWLVSAWMGWFAERRNPMTALLPCILLLAAILSYSEYRIETLWLITFNLLLLMGIWNYKNHTAHWEQKKVDYSDSIRYDVSQAVILLTFAIGLVAFITPSISWREIQDFLRSGGKNELAETLGVQRPPVAPQSAPTQKPTLPREHLLSGGSAQSEKIVMTIRTGELPPVVGPAFTAAAPRYYWRSITYDAYVGAGWVTSSALSQTHQANSPLIPGLLKGYRPLHMEVEMAEPDGRLFWSGILFSADVPLTASWRLRPQSNLFADQSALLQADLFAAFSQARAYQAEAYIPWSSVEELRAASTDYPESIRDRYLRLPGTIPPRVVELAGEITQGRQTAYDRAKAIEAYLRTFPYDLEVPAPPPDQDVVDYFLFDLKKGYCDYYATAMVVLARLSGLPARLVSGYASGSYDAANAEYVVRELHAHSWAEVYFPEIGWIEFEPTAAQPEIERSASTAEPGDVQPSDSTMTRLLYQFRIETAVYWLSPIAILLCAVLTYFTFIERWLYMRLPPATAIENIYRRLYRLGRPLAGERTRAETAQEFKQKLIQQINSITDHSRFTSYLSHVHEDIQLLTDMYQDTLFAHHTISKNDIIAALGAWKHLRWRLFLTRFSTFLEHVILSAKRDTQSDSSR